MTTKKRVLVTAVTAAGLATALMIGTAGADGGGRPFKLALSGANEINAGALINPHGNDDRGTMELRLNPGQEEVCWSVGAITLTGGDSLPTAAHIHQAPAGSAGGVVVNLFGGAAPVPAPTSYPTGTSCVPAGRDLLLDILHDPAAYYVNLHNVPHGGGVMRAQLG